MNRAQLNFIRRSTISTHPYLAPCISQDLEILSKKDKHMNFAQNMALKMEARPYLAHALAYAIYYLDDFWAKAKPQNYL